MKRLLILFVVAILTLTVVFIIYRPDILEKIWLWVIGLIGPIIGFSRAGAKSLMRLTKSNGQNLNDET